MDDVWVPIPLRWRHVRPGDIVLGKHDRPWMVTSGMPRVVTVRSDREYVTEPDPDDTVSVLVPVTERDALRLTRDELGARITDRRLFLPSRVAP